MKLASLLSPWLKVEGTDCDIIGLQNDSRQIQPGFLFFAYPGAATDGRLHLPQAISAGAAAIVYEPVSWPVSVSLPEGIPCIAFTGLAQMLGQIANRFYGEPSKQMVITGVTGTNGKTTTAYQLAQAHSLLGEKAAYVGTIGQGEVNHLQPQINTTPGALFLQELLYGYQQAAIKQVCMEVSSHALSQQRVDCVEFQQAIFTNLSHDHLDYHLNMESYAAAKALLFAKEGLKWAIVNHDDPHSTLMMAAVKKPCQIISYGFNEGADVRALSWDVSLGGTQLRIDSPWGSCHLTIKALGFFNIYNALGIFSSLMAHGYPLEKVIPVMAELRAAPGRMEIVAQEPYAIVDYAHTPDALENVLVTLQKVKKGRILLVFGCGGDRDKSKRPLMGRIASQYADLVIITSDNPRTEDPLAIIKAIEEGVANKTMTYRIVDREQAIAKAISLAEKEDIILIAGKGHEDYQQIGTTLYDFSDQQVFQRLKGDLVKP